MTTNTIREEKKQLRKDLKLRVSRLPEAYCKYADEAICRQILALSEYQQAACVFCYVGTAAEIQTLPLIEQMLADGKQAGVPYCLSLGHMEVRQIRSVADLEEGRYGILAPKDRCPVIAPAAIDLGLIPCCTCNEQGERLGYGGGFYDIYLRKGSFTRAVLCRKQMMTAHIPMEPHDELMDIVISEDGIVRPGTKMGVRDIGTGAADCGLE